MTYICHWSSKLDSVGFLFFTLSMTGLRVSHAREQSMNVSIFYTWEILVFYQWNQLIPTATKIKHSMVSNKLN